MEKNQLVKTASNEIVQKLVLDGDLSKMSGSQKVEYYNSFCQSLGLNPLTQPFQIIKFQGKEKLYATKDCTEQLRKIHGVSITDVTTTELKGLYVATAKAIDINGKADADTGIVNIEGLKGEALANALMKAVTKAKRRVTLSICGLGMLDESELDTMPKHETHTVNQPDVTHDVEAVIVSEPQIKSKENSTGINSKPHETLSKDELDMWEQTIGSANSIDELKVLFNGNKSTINSEPQVYAMFQQRKKYLQTLEVA